MVVTLERSHGDFLAQTSSLRRWLDSAGDDSTGIAPDEAANTRAWCLVWSCAATERFWVPFLEAVCLEFAQWKPRAHRRQIKAQAVFFIDQFFAAVTKDLNPRWERSFELIEDLLKANRAAASVSIPYDGKTVRARHFELYWKLFDLSGSPFPSVIHRQSLETLAEDRNSIAHGDRSPTTLGRLRSVKDVRGSLTRLEETVERVYLTTKGFLGR